jgi:anti-sigma-K factor RskA
MTPPDDIDSLAAEFVLGTLDAQEREQVAARRLRDAELDRAVIYWEQRLGPLAELVLEAPPPNGVYEKIERRIAAAGFDGGLELSRRLRRWRLGAAGAAALAACLALALGVSQFRRAPPQDYVAVLEKGANSVGFLLTLDPASRTLAVRPIAVQAEAGKSYELWLIAPKAGPRSYGLANPTTGGVKSVEGSLDEAEQATWAISLEPEGGSPTGKPTGPVVFEGRFSPIKS